MAKCAGIAHFIYVSVAHPAPAMQAYIAARSACEAESESRGLDATILRPWYVLIPFYWHAEKIPSTQEGARRLGLVTVEQMWRALARAGENPATGVRLIEVPAIRATS